MGAAFGCVRVLCSRELTAYLGRLTEGTTMSPLAGMSWQEVGSVVGRVLARRPTRRADLTSSGGMGTDAFRHGTRHRPSALVVHRDRPRVGEGRGAPTPHGFLDRLRREPRPRTALLMRGPGSGLPARVRGPARLTRRWLRPVPCRTLRDRRPRRGSGGRKNGGRLRKRPRRASGCAIRCPGQHAHLVVDASPELAGSSRSRKGQWPGWATG